MQSSVQIVLVRHGSSEWNLSGRFTGWTDIPLDPAGISQAVEAGRRIVAAGLKFDEAHTSVLRRSTATADYLLAAMCHPHIPRHATWRLNERHYGQLQGMSKYDIFAAWGEENYRRWWRGYFDPPPPLDMDDLRHPRFDARYADLAPEQLPRSESLQDCQRRLLPWWQNAALPALKQGKHLLVVSHGNTLRSLVMHLDRIAPEDIEKVEIPSGVPLVYRFATGLAVTSKEWLE
ncbi:MAG: 2,3-diphosphoglycerate-dependent phosphoglycerate mutase [Nitrosomonadales bacterium]|nr:2,3-diphosphoglycerate-dependent phosphoglycerate mutase [Nitrosomonadales bacterium]